MPGARLCKMYYTYNKESNPRLQEGLTRRALAALSYVTLSHHTACQAAGPWAVVLREDAAATVSG